MPITAKILIVLASAFVAGGTTFVAASDFTALPARVETLEEEQQELTQMVRYLVCRSRSENSEVCEYILPEAVFDAQVR